MQRQHRTIRFVVGDGRYEVRRMGVLGRILTFALSALLLVVAFMFSVVALAVVSVVVVVVIGYLWWKTRDLRRQLRENPPGGRVIDGDAFQDRD